MKESHTIAQGVLFVVTYIFNIWATYRDQPAEITLTTWCRKGIPPKTPKHSGLGI